MQPLHFRNYERARTGAKAASRRLLNRLETAAQRTPQSLTLPEDLDERLLAAQSERRCPPTSWVTTMNL